MKKKCVFVLEDNDDLRELFTILLEDDNFKVVTYPTATSFKAGMESEKPCPDIILMDIMLPDGNGMDICAQMKADKRYSAIPIIMMSAHKDMSDVTEFCKADDFIAKPFDINRFINTVERYAGR